MATAQKPLLLGGEMSMWTDNYCNVRQCGAYSGDPPVGSKMFPPEQDAAFQRSVGGMIWPRGFVAAASYWNWDNKTDPASPAFVKSIWKLNDALQARNLSTCPTNCSCDEVSACGKPYIPPPPPWAGCELFNCTCKGMADWYGVCNDVSTDPQCKPGRGFGCAPVAAQNWWIHEAKPCAKVGSPPSCCAESAYTKHKGPFPGCGNGTK